MTAAKRALRLGLPAGTLVIASALQLGDFRIDHLAWEAGVLFALLAIAMIFATVFAVLHHAEAIAHRIGEPYGTLVLTGAVTIIEASVIISLMLHGENNPTLARESVFSTIMIVTAGVVGICMTLGGWRHRHQNLKPEGTRAYLSVLIALAVLTLVLPDYILTTTPGTFSTAQLALASLLSLLLYGTFLVLQTGRHRDDFLDDIPDNTGPEKVGAAGMAEASHPADGVLGVSVVLLVLGLTGIVLLTEHIAGAVEDGLVAIQVSRPDALVGVFIATLVLAPEALAAMRAAWRNELQRSLNIALGSACATIGLTIPAVGAMSLLTGRSLTLGLEPGDMVLLLLSLLISVVSFGTGRTNVLTGLVHLVVFVAYICLVLVP